MSSLADQMRDWHRGVQAVARGDWDCALRLFSGHSQLPARMCFNMGCVHLLAGDPEAALRAFDRAVAKDTCMAVGFLQRGAVSFQLERFPEAESDFQRALAQMRGNAAIDYTQLGLHFRLQAWDVLHNVASAQCQAGLWTQAANTLVEAISTWPEGAQHGLDAALQQVRNQVPLQLRQVPRGEVFQPPQRYLQYLEPMDFLGKAKVVAPAIPSDPHADAWPPQRPQLEQVGPQAPLSTGLLACGGPGPIPSEDPSGTGGAAANGPESLVAVTVQCRVTATLKVPRGASLASLRAMLADALHLQAQRGQLSYQTPDGELWIPIAREEALQGVWRDVATTPRGLRLQCQGAGGRPVLYQVVAQHDYLAQGPEDLVLHRGDTVDVLCEVDGAWLEGHHDGYIGIFPKCFVIPASACEDALPVLDP